MFKSGYVAIVGKPNVGKSTLLNYFVGQKIAIVTPKPQTTRECIAGILTTDAYQIIFLDTPGIHIPKDQLHNFMQKEINFAFKEADLILFMITAESDLDEEDMLALEHIKKIKTSHPTVPIFLVINKIDLNPEQGECLRRQLSESNLFAETFVISALNHTNCDELKEKIVTYLPNGPQYYPADELTDRPERFFVGELIREKIYEMTYQEIPYSVAVVTEEVKEEENRFYIRATIYTEKDSQKGIIIGAGGERLKKIGELARREIEFFLGKPVYLDLWVKVKKNWRKSVSALKQLGFKFR